MAAPSVAGEEEIHFPGAKIRIVKYKGRYHVTKHSTGSGPVGLQGTIYLYMVMSCRLLRQGRHSTQNPAQEELLRGTSKTSTTIGSARESRTRI